MVGYQTQPQHTVYVNFTTYLPPKLNIPLGLICKFKKNKKLYLISPIPSGCGFWLWFGPLKQWRLTYICKRLSMPGNMPPEVSEPALLQPKCCCNFLLHTGKSSSLAKSHVDERKMQRKRSGVTSHFPLIYNKWSACHCNSPPPTNPLCIKWE